MYANCAVIKGGMVVLYAEAVETAESATTRRLERPISCKGK